MRAIRSPRLTAVLEDPLLRSAYSLMANVALTSALGLGFWVVAAQLFSTTEVGEDAALIAAMVAVSTVCGLNLSSGILRFLPISRLGPSRVVLGTYTVTAVFSLVGGAAFVIAAPALSSRYSFLAHNLSLDLLWVAAVVAWGVFTLQDAVLTALRMAPWVPLENTVFGVVKFAALPVLLAIGGGHPIFVGWVIPMVALLVPVNYGIFRRFIPRRSISTAERSPVEQLGWAGLGRFLLNDYLAMIFIQAGSTLLPVLVLGLLGGASGAYFYMPFTIVGALDTLFFQVFSSMTVEAAVAPARLAEHARTTVRRFAGLLAIGVGVLLLGASIVLLPFGHGYATHGAAVMRLLACASPLRALVDLYCAICRVRGRTGPVLACQAALFVVIGALTLSLGRLGGLQGVGLAWLIGNAIVAAAVAPPVLAVLREGHGRRIAEVPFDPARPADG